MIISPTALYQDDLLREHAIEFGVHINDFVPKGVEHDGITWEGHLLSAVLSHMRTLRYGHYAPLLKMPFVKIQILPATNLSEHILALEVNGKLDTISNPTWCSVLWQLMKAAKRLPGRNVPMEKFTCFDGKTQESINGDLRRLWQHIAQVWLLHQDISEASDAEKAVASESAKLMMESVKDSAGNQKRVALALHALVIDEHCRLNYP